MKLQKTQAPHSDANTLEIRQKLQRYLAQVLDTPIQLQTWKAQDKLPLHLLQAFDFTRIDLLGQSVIAALDRGKAWTVGGLQKQLGLVSAAAQAPALFVSEAIRPLDRARLIQKRIAFVIPAKQMYLPPLGIDFKEHFVATKLKPGRLTASAQLVLIHSLLNPGLGALRPRELAKLFKYTPMTLTRAFNELEANGLAQSLRQGRQRSLKWVVEGKALWERARELMASPVAKRMWIPAEIKLPVDVALSAGLSALARLSDLAEPEIPVLAVPPAGWEWAGLGTYVKEKSLDRPEPGSQEVQTWAYAPHLLSKGPCVDPFSLYLSLQDSGDERVETALEQLERLRW